MPNDKRDPLLGAMLEGLTLIGSLGAVLIVSFGIFFGLGWALDHWLNANVFKWVGLVLGVVSLYWNGARTLRKYWRSNDEDG